MQSIIHKENQAYVEHCKRVSTDSVYYVWSGVKTICGLNVGLTSYVWNDEPVNCEACLLLMACK